MERKVIVYSTPSCPFCNNVKSYLMQKGIEFEEHDVSADREKAIEMYKKSGSKSVPVIDVEGKIVVGFDPAKLEKALYGMRVDRNAFMSNVIFDPFDQ